MRLVRVLALAGVVVLGTACGGDGGSSSTDAEFCDYLRTLEDLDPEAAPADALAAIDEVIDRAPNTELRSALLDLRPIFELMTTLDPNDEDAFTQMMSIMFDPKVIAAGEVLDTYGTEVCGFEDTSTDAPLDSDVSFTTTPDMSTPATALEELESSDISDAAERVLADLAPGAYVASSGWSSFGSTFSVDVDITGTDAVDGVPVCEAVVDLLRGVDAQAEFSISITLDGTPIASSNMDSCLGLIR
jgi:hypothetical protein